MLHAKQFSTYILRDNCPQMHPHFYLHYLLKTRKIEQYFAIITQNYSYFINLIETSHTLKNFLNKTLNFQTKRSQKIL